MRRAVAAGLVREAFLQVLDNRVFRVLAVLALVPILATYAIGFREDRIELLFGMKSWSYDSLLGAFGYSGPVDDVRAMAVGRLAEILVEGMAGTVGVALAIAATAFFVPRMLEKGAADVLFHKPVSRAALYLSRYVAGLLFVALLSLVLVVGMYAGFRVASGYDDPGILWAALTLTYLFALLHGVTMLVGVLTRSSVASILLALVFFFGNGCIHGGWLVKEMALEEVDRARARALEQMDPEDPESAAAISEHVQEPHRVVRFLGDVLDGLHLVLPKTLDADVLTKRLRRGFERQPAFEAEGGFTIVSLPGDMEPADPEGAPGPDLAPEVLGPPSFAARSGDVALTIHVRPRSPVARPTGGTRPERRTDAARTLQDALAAAGHGVERFDAELRLRDESGIVVERDAYHPVQGLAWSSGGRAWSAGIAQVGSEIAIALASAPADRPDDARRALDETLEEASPAPSSPREDWYSERVGWDAPLPYNLLFSIASSLAFTALVLLLGLWRLSRLDF